MAQRYAVATGRETITDIGYYKAFNLFRVAAIIQGVVARQLAGNAVDPQAIEQAGRVAPLAEAAWTEAVGAGAGQPAEPFCAGNATSRSYGRARRLRGGAT
jgi:hypothetical protein